MTALTAHRPLVSVSLALLGLLGCLATAMAANDGQNGNCATDFEANDIGFILNAMGPTKTEQDIAAGDMTAQCYLQLMLKFSGYAITVDGQVGPKTRQTLASFAQDKCGLSKSDQLSSAVIKCYRGLPKQASASLASVKIPVQAKPGCKSAAGSSDPDFRRHAASFDQGHLCYELKRVSEAGRNWLVQIVTNKNKPNGPWWVLPHDNENSAFDGAVYAATVYGGGFITVETGEGRIFDGQDPNRNFSQRGVMCTGKRHGSDNFTKAVISALPSTSSWPIFALHTNSNGFSGNGGSGTISVYRQSSAMIGIPSNNARGIFADEDMVVITAGTSRRPSGRTQEIVDRLLRAGTHVIYEPVTASRNDCSLSNFAVLEGKGLYFNLEVQSGRSNAMKAMIDRVISQLPRN